MDAVLRYDFATRELPEHGLKAVARKLGLAKEDLEATARRMDAELQAGGGHAYVSVNKALVTQASSAIPVVPLYISLLYKVMKEKGLHEGCIEQIYRLFAERLVPGANPQLDEHQRVRVDDWEMRPEVQEAVAQLWSMPGPRPDAIFCGNDQIARAVIDALRERGVRVPEDVSVVGFDNWEIVAAQTRPPLTTVDMNLKALGREAGLTVLALAEGRSIEPGIRTLPCELIVRQSCGGNPDR